MKIKVLKIKPNWATDLDYNELSDSVKQFLVNHGYAKVDLTNDKVKTNESKK